MSTSLLSLVDNLPDGFHSDKCIDCNCSLDYMITRDDQLIVRYFECKKNYQKDFNKDLINRIANTYDFIANIIIDLFYFSEKEFILINT